MKESNTRALKVINLLSKAETVALQRGMAMTNAIYQFNLLGAAQRQLAVSVMKANKHVHIGEVVDGKTTYVVAYLATTKEDKGK